MSKNGKGDILICDDCGKKILPGRDDYFSHPVDRHDSYNFSERHVCGKCLTCSRCDGKGKGVLPTSLVVHEANVKGKR